LRKFEVYAIVSCDDALLTSRRIMAMAGMVYIFQEGDTLATIAEKQCGDAKLADALAAMNRIEDPSMLYSGVHIILDCDALKAWHPDAQPFTGGPNFDRTVG
jgi:hypothetical protein